MGILVFLPGKVEVGDSRPMCFFFLRDMKLNKMGKSNEGRTYYVVSKQNRCGSS